MPNENPPPRSIFAEIETVLHALSLYGAAGLAAFGWGIGWFFVSAESWLPLWFCAALLIYNADRLRRDPADALNVPARTAASARLRTAGFVTLILAALVLVGLPVWRHDWLTLGLVIGGAIISLGYSIPILGFRWKDVPLVKTLFAPAVVTAAVFGLVIFVDAPGHPSALHIHHGSGVFDLFFASVCLVPWAFCHLLFNMLLCDLRDRVGDAQCGIRSIPVVWGEKGARRLLWGLAVTGQVILALLLRSQVLEQMPIALLSLLTGLYQACLLLATRRPRSERFYEWAVEGLLYLPALARALTLFIYRHTFPVG